MAKIHNITGNHLSNNSDGGGSASGDVDLSKYATINYSDSEDQKIKKEVNELAAVGKEYVDSQIAAIEIPDTEVNLNDYALVTYSDENDSILKDYIDAELAAIPEFPSIDLEGYATEAQLTEVDRTSIMRDDALAKTHKEDDEKLQENIDVVVRELEDLKTQLGAILGPNTGSFVYSYAGDNQWVSTPGSFSTGLENNHVTTFLFSTVDNNSSPVDFTNLEAGDILYFNLADESKVQETVVHTWVVDRVEPQGDVVRVYVANKAKPVFIKNNLYSLQIHDATRLNESSGADVTADYDWTGHHKYTGGKVEIDNTDGGVTYHGWQSDYSGSNERSWMKFRLNASGEYYLHFGPTGNYWETRWTLNTGKMTWGQTQSGDPSVAIDKYGLKVKGSSVTRNATMLQALKSSTDFESLKAKLIELLEEEAASYEVEEEAC